MIDKTAFDYIVLIKGHEYRIKDIGRNKAIFQAVRQYKEETGDPVLVGILAYMASCTKITDGRKLNI